MDIYDLKELEKLLKEYLSLECLNNYSVNEYSFPFTKEKLEKLKDLNNKTNTTIECLKNIQKSIQEN